MDKIYNYRLRVIPLLFNLLYSVPFKFPLQPYLGGGVGVFISSLDYSYNEPAHGSGKITDKAFGYGIRFGLSYVFDYNNLVAEYRFVSSLLDSSGVAGEVGGSTFLLGYRAVF